MAAKRSAAEMEQLRREFLVRAEAAFEQMFGADGQNGLVTFTEREDRACEVTDALPRLLLEEHLTLDEAADPGVQVDYARYRVQGLPITSALVESLIKQFNYRVKGTEKFWRREGAEAVLQCRAAYLSDDDRAARFYGQRPPGPAVGKNRRKRAA